MKEVSLKGYILLLAFALIGCTRPQSSEIMVKNVYGEILSWQKFPVVFSFHSSFPEDKKAIVQLEITKFNLLAKAEVFRLSPEPTTKEQPQKNEKDGINTLYWDFNQAFNMSPSEQGKASIFWMGSEIQEADINLQSLAITQVDFSTLLRHELLHSLGLSHSDYELMSPYLPIDTIRDWDQKLISQWTQEIRRYAKVQLPLVGENQWASSGKEKSK